MGKRPTGKGNFRSPGSKVQWTAPGAQQGVADLKKQARAKPEIDWVDAPKGTSMRREHFPSMYKEPPNLDPAIAAQFVIGHPVMAARPLTMSLDRGTYDFAPLETFYGGEDEAHIPVGSLLVYTGEVRQTERMYVNGKFRDVSVVKHTFITPMGRCIIHDFNLIRLITDKDLE